MSEFDAFIFRLRFWAYEYGKGNIILTALVRDLKAADDMLVLMYELINRKSDLAPDSRYVDKINKIAAKATAGERRAPAPPPPPANETTTKGEPPLKGADSGQTP